MYAQAIKPFFDIMCSFCFLVLASPFFLVVFIGLYLVNKGNVFFFQLRPGKDEKIFKIIKFKTMTDARDGEGKLLPDVDRLTAFGKFVRTTSLDELPQLVNVLKGDMSLVGPRPLLPEYLPLYTEQQNKRHLVKPGITGWAQVNGRNTISWEHKFELDIWYVKNISFMLDVQIIFKTIEKVINRKGIAPDGFDITPRFDEVKKNN